MEAATILRLRQGELCKAPFTHRHRELEGEEDGSLLGSQRSVVSYSTYCKYFA